MQRIRFVFQKIGELRFLSHLELMKALAAALAARAGADGLLSGVQSPAEALVCPGAGRWGSRGGRNWRMSN